MTVTLAAAATKPWLAHDTRLTLVNNSPSSTATALASRSGSARVGTCSYSVTADTCLCPALVTREAG